MKNRSANPPRVLVADDQTGVLEALRLLLKAEGYIVETATSPAALLKAVERDEFDAALMDLNYARDTTSGQEGLDLVARLQTMDGSLPVVVMTAWGSVDLAVEAMRRGARDFIQKPWDNARLLTTLRTQVELARALRQGQRLAAENRLLQPSGVPALEARSAAMSRVLDVIRRVAPSDASVLITGEHGAGKEVVARALHAHSTRSGRAMVSLNAGSIPEGLFESELFGHVKGAFTGATADHAGHIEIASGGTLFLDEIANVPLAQQAKLLRVIESREVQRVGSSRCSAVDVRLLTATNADLRAEAAAGRFREDLLFRLNTIEIHVPPLRERREDILPLAREFLKNFAARYGKAVSSFDPLAEKSLAEYSWPGNVRELNHAVERGVLMAQQGAVSTEDLGLRPDSAQAGRWEDLPLGEAESLLIRKCLERYDGNISQAAHALGLSRSALYRRLERHGIKAGS